MMRARQLAMPLVASPYNVVARCMCAWAAGCSYLAAPVGKHAACTGPAQASPAGSFASAQAWCGGGGSYLDRCSNWLLVAGRYVGARGRTDDLDGAAAGQHPFSFRTLTGPGSPASTGRPLHNLASSPYSRPAPSSQLESSGSRLLATHAPSLLAYAGRRWIGGGSSSRAPPDVRPPSSSSQ